MRISAIITAYNGAPFVSRAIESVLAQSRPLDEVLVIDDGSTDGTAQVVEGYQDQGVRLIRQENRGLSRARNRGIEETKGDLIAFLDCDDIWLPEKTALQEESLIANPRSGLVTCQVTWWDGTDKGQQLPPLRIGRSQAAMRRKLAVRNYVGNASAVMARRQVFDDVGGFDPTQVWAEDWELWRRIAQRYEILLVDRPLMIYRTVPASLTQQKRRIRADEYYRLSRKAIGQVRPWFWRPILILRSWSWREYSRAVCARLDGLPRRRHFLHALLALVSYPCEWTREKFKDFARACLGESFYRRYSHRRALKLAAARRSGS